MKKSIIYLLATILLSTTFMSCQKVPITGRKQLKLLPSSYINSMGNESYASFLKENPAVAPPTIQSAAVTAVGERVSAAVTKYMNDNGMAKRIEGYKWEFNTVDSKDVNAWCMPGGKVVVYTGLLPITKDDAGLAVVMGHEIAHAIAEHGNERMSQQLAIEAAGIGLELYMQQKPEQTRNIFLSAFGVGSQLGILAYSRQHELEADKLGLIFMAMAGYDPQRSLSFWKEMAASGSGSVPEFLSTHPSDEHRIAEITKFLPEAQKYYVAGGQQTTPQKTIQPSGTTTPGNTTKTATKTTTTTPSNTNNKKSTGTVIIKPGK